MIDYQMHTVNSDGLSTVDEMIATAERIGLAEIAITDHFSPRGDSGQLNAEELARYFSQVERARARHTIPVRIGLEVEYYEEMEQVIEHALSELPWDYVLGSVHRILQFDISDGVLYTTRSQLEVYDAYFSKWARAASSGLFDIMAHADYVRRWAVPFYGAELPLPAYAERLTEPLRHMAKHRIGFEVNCGGIRRGEGTTYPSAGFVSLARSQGVELVTVSSDAHRAGDLSIACLRKGAHILRTAGYDQLFGFTARSPSPHALNAF